MLNYYVIDIMHIRTYADNLDRMLPGWMYTVLCSGIFVLAAAKRSGLTTVSSSCPSEWLSAEFTIVADRVIDASQGRTFILDPTGSHLSDVMGFTPSRIATEIQTVRDYLNTTFGLTFSGLDANGEATFQNATLSYFRVPFRHHVTYNRWIPSGRTRSRCYDAFNGGLQVTFSGNQLLRGTYGGPTGISVTAGDDILYGYYRIDVHNLQPIEIQYQSNIPGRPTPVDNYIVNDIRTYHSQLGFGREIATFRITPFNEDGSQLRAEFRSMVSFPNPPPLVGLDN